jgi:hypothetical protein
MVALISTDQLVITETRLRSGADGFSMAGPATNHPPEVLVESLPLTEAS